MKKYFHLKSAALLCIFWFCGAYLLMAQLTFSAIGLPEDLPDPGSVTKTITVSGLSGTVATANEIQVNFAIDHGWARDIRVSVTPPGGSEIIIVNTIGTSSIPCYSPTNFVASNVFTISQSATGLLSLLKTTLFAGFLLVMLNTSQAAVTAFSSGVLTISLNALNEGLTLSNNGTTITVSSTASIIGAGSTFSPTLPSHLPFPGGFMFRESTFSISVKLTSNK